MSDEMKKHSNTAYNILTGLVLVCFLAVTAQIVYWKSEADPLVVELVEDNHSKSVGQAFAFKRLVQSDKDLTITVKSFWHATDGSMDIGDMRGEFVEKETVTYNLNAGFKMVMTFNRVIPSSEDITKGVHEYIPVASYQINPIKTVVKPLPTQIVEYCPKE